MARPEHHAIAEKIIWVCREMNRLGINQGTSGNVSARVPGGFLITPSGLGYDGMTPEQIVEMDLDGGYHGDLLPSSEWRMHQAIYARRPEAQAVLHAHPVSSTALSCLNEGIPAFHYMVGVAGGADIRCAGYATFGTEALSDMMLEALDGRSACLLANHGMICFSRDLNKVLGLAVEVETLARQYLQARSVGSPVILSAAQMDEVLLRFQSYGKQPADLPPGHVLAVDGPKRIGPGRIDQA